MLTSQSLLHDLLSGTKRVALNLRRGAALECRTPRHHRISELRQLVLDANERLQREINDELDGPATRPEEREEPRRFAADPFGCGLLYEPSPAEPWHGFTPPVGHPDGCGCPDCINVALVVAKDDLRLMATANTSLDREAIRA